MTALDSWHAVRDAMVVGDTSALDSLLDDGFTLTHMTGYVQSKVDWLDAIDSNEMQYHEINDVETAAAGAVLTVRTITDATIWGGRAEWRLQLCIRVDLQGPVARAVLEMVASVW